jgi:hypothetical protein
MPVNGDSYEFSLDSINITSSGKGVYSLHKGGETIYIGRADCIGGIRRKLQAHLSGDEGQCTQQATSYRFELKRNPVIREEELLLEYKFAHGRLPLCNKQTD